MFKAGDVMRCPVIKICQDATVNEAVDLFLKYQISGIPVIDGEGKLVGMFSQIDLINLDDLTSDTRRVGECMSRDVASVDVDDPVSDVSASFRALQIHRLPVTSHGEVVGIIGGRDLVAFARKTEKVNEDGEPLLADTPGCDD